MSNISELSWTGCVLSWKAEQILRQVKLDREVVNAIPLLSGGVAVIEGNDWTAHAIIFNLDGSLRVSLQNPFRPEDGMVFYYFNYEGANLIVVLAGTTRDFACQVDELTGVLSSPRETR